MDRVTRIATPATVVRRTNASVEPSSFHASSLHAPALLDLTPEAPPLPRPLVPVADASGGPVVPTTGPLAPVPMSSVENWIARESATRWKRSPWIGVALAAIVAAGATALRIYQLNTGYAVSADELNYLQTSHNIALHFNQAFSTPAFLGNAPGFLVAAAGLMKLFGMPADAAGQLVLVHYAGIGISVLTVLALYAAGTSIGGRIAGVAAAGLFAFDPYLVAASGMSTGEPLALLFAVSGLALLLRGIQANYVGFLRAVVVGFFFAASVYCSETAAAVTIVPALVWLFLGCDVKRAHSFTILFVSLALCAIYPWQLYEHGLLQAWWNVNSQNIGHFFGLYPANDPHAALSAESVVANLRDNLGMLGISAGVLAGGALSAIYLFMRGSYRTGQRTVAAMSLCGLLVVAGAIVYGDVSYQTFYVAALPSLIVIATATLQLVRRFKYLALRKIAVTAALSLAAAGYAGLSGYLWTNANVLAASHSAAQAQHSAAREW